MTHYNPLALVKNRVNKDLSPVSIIGLSGSALSYFFSQFLADLNKPCLVILPEKKEAERLYKELRFFMSEPDKQNSSETIRLYEFPPYDLTPLTGISPHRELVSQRLQALYVLMSEKTPVIITSFDAICFKVLPKEAFLKSIDYLEVGEEIERDLFLRKLEVMGYQRSSLVEERGDYSVRGGVIDLFSPLFSMPVRLEFWGDRLESIRQFDPLNQRSQSHLEEFVLLPAAEIIMDIDNLKRARSMGRLPSRPEGGVGFSGQEAWLNHFYPCLDSIFRYLPENGLIVVSDSHRAEPQSKKVKKGFEKDIERSRKEASEKGLPFPDVGGIFVPFHEIVRHLDGYRQLNFNKLDLSTEDTRKNTIHIKSRFLLDNDFEVRLAGKGKVSMAPFAEKISEWLALGARVVITSRTEQQANRLKEILANYDVIIDRVSQCWIEIPKDAGLSVCLGRLSKGFSWPEMGIFVVSEDEVFGPKKNLTRKKGRAGESLLTWSSFSQLKAGDFIVHEDHGIGRYLDLVKMEFEQKANDFVIIEYANNARLYIPADRISILQKYAGADEKAPKLDQLGGRSWNIAKQKADKSIKKIAKQLLGIYALREHKKGYAFSLPDYDYREFEATFEHEETSDQVKAIEDVLADMASERPMDRLICGDVGFGKTEVAIRAAFMAVSDGKQVALLVPTTVLAEQHYETFKKRMGAYHIRVGIISRFRSRAAQVEILGKLRSGELDILVGTHRILQKDVNFRDLGLIIIDEEQRFGVKQKETLRKYRAMVDVLAITATPVPRTMYMSMMGVRDLSLIETPPEDRHTVQTCLSPYDESLIIRAIEFELERGGQVFFVHNRVRTIDHMTDQLKLLVPQARLGIAHGQMKASELEKTMMRFLTREVDVLVCSTIIESGLDIASANTIIINEVDRMGLAQIYQLRGRVGRSKEKAYAYLFLSSTSTLTRDAEKRLKALMDFSHLGAGIHLAMHDLKIRGSGNILGFAQSGHISVVGYELYLKLIERAVADLKGEEWHEDINPEINGDIAAFLPESYVIDTDVRLNLYRRLSSLRKKADLDVMAEEIHDRFGMIPPEVSNLFGLMAIRLLLKDLAASRLDIGHDSLIITFSQQKKIDTERLIRLVNGKPNRYQFLSQYKLQINVGKISLPQDFSKVQESIDALYHCYLESESSMHHNRQSQKETKDLKPRN